MHILTYKEFVDRVKAQCVDRVDYAFVCPMCGTVQSARDLIDAGAGGDFADVEKYLGFSCVGRFTGAGSPSAAKEKGGPCNWTLGGFLNLHQLEVITEDGKSHPHFAPATPEQAHAHALRQKSSETETI